MPASELLTNHATAAEAKVRGTGNLIPRIAQCLTKVNERMLVVEDDLSEKRQRNWPQKFFSMNYRLSLSETNPLYVM